MIKVSVCVPVYNVENYIEQCVRSLFEQTLVDLEYIFIDDASTDHSINVLQTILNEYPHRKSHTLIIRHKTNKGVSATRKEAIFHASGEYVIHCDADDWVEAHIYEKLHGLAEESNADMVYCSFSHEFDDVIKREYIEREFDRPAEMIKAFFVAQSHCSLWNKLYKRNICQDMELDLPDDITMCEDLRINVQMLLKCRKIVCCPDVMYHYRVNMASLTTGKRGPQSFQSEIDNINLFDKLLPYAEFGKSLDAYKRRTLLEACMLRGISARQWHSLWKRAKMGMLTTNYPFKLKAIFYLACCNYSFASWLWRKIKELHS